MKRRCMITVYEKKIVKKKGVEQWDYSEGREIEAKIDGVYRDEFYKASASGMKPVAQFYIHPSEWNGERFILHNGKRYRVIRDYPRTLRETVLVCEGDEPNDA